MTTKHALGSGVALLAAVVCAACGGAPVAGMGAENLTEGGQPGTQPGAEQGTEMEGTDVAGGQSGTDSTSSGYCDLDPESAYEIDQFEVIEELGASPNTLINLARGIRTLHTWCGESTDVELIIDIWVEREARIVPGTLVTGSGSEASCETLDLAVQARAWTTDGTVDARATVVRFWPMRLRPLGDIVFLGTGAVDAHLDFSSFLDRDESSVVTARVYPSGELDEEGFLHPDDPNAFVEYSDVGYFCEPP